jgi:predicted butyrate kinase (DUF1464 family)
VRAIGDVEAVLADHEGRFVLVEARAAVLLHAQVALRDALHHLVVEHTAQSTMNCMKPKDAAVGARLVAAGLGGDEAVMPSRAAIRAGG